MGKKKAVNEVLIYINQYIFRKKKNNFLHHRALLTPVSHHVVIACRGCWKRICNALKVSVFFLGLKTRLLCGENKPCLGAKEALFATQRSLLLNAVIIQIERF